MSSKLARWGFPAKADPQEEKDAIERLRKAELFFASEVWQTIAGPLREIYYDLLIACPATEDLQRYRLQVALQVIEMVESDAKAVHSSAAADVEKLKKQIDRQTKKPKNPHRR